MPTRESAPPGAPCWIDLWTSDVEGSRRFYGELFGWEAGEPSPEFGGYFMFLRDGVPVAGGMGDMGEARADDTWKTYLCVRDLARTVEAAAAAGARIISPPTEVGDMGSQAVLVDPTGTTFGAWQPGTFPGFTVLGEVGTPDWFELHTRDHAAAVAFYRDVFGWDTVEIPNNDRFRYTMMRDPRGEGELAGIFDASSSLPEGAPPHWSVYWRVDDADAVAARAKSLGGTVVTGPSGSRYGRTATLTDPAGAYFRLRALNA